MKVLFIDNTHPLLVEKLSTIGFKCEFFNGLYAEELYDSIAAYTGIVIRSKFRIDKDFINRAVNLKFIARVGAGMDSIDVAYAEKRGIALLNSPEGNRIAVGEHTVGMLLCLLNKINTADAQIRNGIRKREENRGVEVCGKTIGIIGYGNMGSAFAKCVSGFGAHVLAYDKYKTGFSDSFVKESNLKTIFEKTDILSIHVPLTIETHYMVDEPFINKFKKNFYLINTSRGKVVKTSALTDALINGKIKGTALDVIEYEADSFENLSYSELPPSYTYLLQAENVVMTPHIAGWTEESKVKLVEVLAEKISRLNL